MSQSHVLKHSHPPFVRCDDAPLVESEKSETVAGTEDVGTEDGSIGDGSVEDEGIEDNGIGDKDTEDEGRESLSGIDDESIEEEDVSPSALEEELENAEVDPCYDYGRSRRSDPIVYLLKCRRRPRSWHCFHGRASHCSAPGPPRCWTKQIHRIDDERGNLNAKDGDNLRHSSRSTIFRIMVLSSPRACNEAGIEKAVQAPRVQHNR